MAARKHRREIKLHRVPKPTQVEITDDGLSFWIKGSRKRLSINWFQVVSSANTPVDVPSFLAGKPIEFLIHQAAKRG